jgi:hypothetical protein
MATQMLAASLARPDRAFLLTDGISRVYTLVGGQTLSLMAPEWPRLEWTVSLVPLSEQLEGLTYTGLDYPLTGARLERGSTRGVSNRFTQTGRATIRLKPGAGAGFRDNGSIGSAQVVFARDRLEGRGGIFDNRFLDGKAQPDITLENGTRCPAPAIPGGGRRPRRKRHRHRRGCAGKDTSRPAAFAD